MDTSYNPVHLSDLGPEDFKKFMDSFDHVFSDCDGVIWLKTALPNVAEFFSLMEKHGKTVHFVSNNSVRSKENYDMKFEDAGIDNGFERLTIPSLAIADYLKEHNKGKAVYCVACVETVKTIQSHGIICKTGPEITVSSYDAFISYLRSDPDIGAVAFDSDVEGNLGKMQKAITYLKKPEVLFLTGATDRHVYLAKGYQALGAAIFTEIVAEETGRKPIILSKPSKHFGEFAMKRAGVTNPERVLFIGDMIDQDIAFGKATGFKTLLVLTNLPKETMLSHETIRPHFYANSLASVVPLLKKHNK